MEWWKNDIAYAFIGFIVRTVVFDGMASAWRKKHDTSHALMEARLERTEQAVSGGVMTDNELKIGELVPAMRAKALNFLARAKSELGYDLRITESYRTPQQQDKYYAQGRSTPGPIITWAKGNDPGAYHVQRRAFDIVRRTSDSSQLWNLDWARLAQIGEECGLAAGLRWASPKTDRPHFQYTGAADIAAVVLEAVVAPLPHLDWVTAHVNVNVRSAPSHTALLTGLRTLKRGDRFLPVEVVAGSDPYHDGRNKWYRNDHNEYAWSGAF